MTRLSPHDIPTAEVVRRLLAYALRLGASREDAEEVVQEAITQAISRPEWFDAGRASLVTALGTIVRNRLIDRHRHRATGRRLAPQLRLVRSEDPWPDAAVAQADAKACRRALLVALEPDERRLFAAWLRQRRGELTAQTAAHGLSMTRSDYENAKKRLRRRIRALADELGLSAEHLFDPAGGGA